MNIQRCTQPLDQIQGLGLRGVLCFGLVCLLCVTSACQRVHPDLVIDEAGLLDADQKERIALFHSLLLSDHNIDYRVVTSHNVKDINEVAARRFADLDVGGATDSAYGLLLIVDDGAQEVRLEVGYALEPYFPDAFVAYIEHRQMLPFFAARRVSDGILATTELIIDRAQRYALGAEGSSETWQTGSGGGGATAREGQHARPKKDRATLAQEAKQSPQETLTSYFKAMSENNADPQLEIYTPETRAMLSDWIMTPAQMANLVATYRGCSAQNTRYDASGKLAVIRYPITQRRCAPWFFRRMGDVWELDLTMLSRAVRFGRDNSWHFDMAVRHPYEFAFTDWQFDRNGFPER